MGVVITNASSYANWKWIREHIVGLQFAYDSSENGNVVVSLDTQIRHRLHTSGQGLFATDETDTITAAHAASVITPDILKQAIEYAIDPEYNIHTRHPMAPEGYTVLRTLVSRMFRGSVTSEGWNYWQRIAIQVREEERA